MEKVNTTSLGNLTENETFHQHINTNMSGIEISPTQSLSNSSAFAFVKERHTSTDKSKPNLTNITGLSNNDYYQV